MDKKILKIDWASYQSTLYACTNWHYSKSIPVPPLIKIGVWENNKFIGVVIFSRGASPKLVRPYGLTQTEGVELSRIALTNHVTPVSRIVKIAIKFLLLKSPGIKLIVSFADSEQGHRGGIYQAGNWIYSGKTKTTKQYLLNGKKLHSRQVSITGRRKQFGVVRAVYRPDQLTVKVCEGKHRYLMPLTKEMREKIKHISKPYPK